MQDAEMDKLVRLLRADAPAAECGPQVISKRRRRSPIRAAVACSSASRAVIEWHCIAPQRDIACRVIAQNQRSAHSSRHQRAVHSKDGVEWQPCGLRCHPCPLPRYAPVREIGANGKATAWHVLLRRCIPLRFQCLGSRAAIANRLIPLIKRVDVLSGFVHRQTAKDETRAIESTGRYGLRQRWPRRSRIGCSMCLTSLDYSKPRSPKKRSSS
jgi:hypothetical protein